MTDVNIKRCSKCKECFPHSNFHKNQTAADGLQSQCKSCSCSSSKQWRSKNPNYLKTWQSKNREHYNKYFREKYHHDINFRLAHKLRNRIRKALLNQDTTKGTTTEDLLGCSYSQFRKWIEFQFNEGMTFNNVELDHVRTLTSFDLTNEEQLREASTWKNIQPLFKRDNLTKGAKFNEMDYQLQFIKAHEFLSQNK